MVVPYHDLVRRRVCDPAGIAHTEFLRSDELPGRRRPRLSRRRRRLETNVFHLPVRGSGDGGIYSTVADLSRALGRCPRRPIVSAELGREMVRPHSDVPSKSKRYGLGFWLHAATDAVILEGY